MNLQYRICGSNIFIIVIGAENRVWLQITVLTSTRKIGFCHKHSNTHRTHTHIDIYTIYAWTKNWSVEKCICEQYSGAFQTTTKACVRKHCCLCDQPIAVLRMRRSFAWGFTSTHTETLVPILFCFFFLISWEFLICLFGRWRYIFCSRGISSNLHSREIAILVLLVFPVIAKKKLTIGSDNHYNIVWWKTDWYRIIHCHWLNTMCIWSWLDVQ